MEEKARRFDPDTGTCIVRTDLECLPCFFGQVARTLTFAGVNGEWGRRITKQATCIIEQASLDEVPARTTTLIHRLLRQELGVDPYQKIKKEYNRISLDRLPAIRKLAGAAADPIEGGARAAIAGNVIDFGIYESIDLDGSINDAFRLPLSLPDCSRFLEAVERSRRILYLCDNAGEIVFDRVLIEILRTRGKSVTAAVKGSPVINDATLDDAADAGLASCASVIDNGNDGIGTLLEACSEQFTEAYRTADLIISKGQANYETLIGMDDPRLFFLFKVKCSVVARSLDRENGDIILMGGRG